MSPEQAQGDRRVDHRTDLWALGVITFEALVGRRPFEASNLGDLLVKICALDPPTPSTVLPSVPDGFDEWFLRACARNPEDRFPDAKEMAATLAILCGTIPAVLSDKSFVSLTQAGAAYEDSGSQVRVASPAKGPPRSPAPGALPSAPAEDAPIASGEPPLAIAEGDPTQVMPMPAEVADPDSRANVVLAEQGRQPARNVNSPLVVEPPRVATPPRQDPRRLPNLSIEEDAEDERVEIFSAAVVAENIARVKAEREREARRNHRIALLHSAKWPALGLAVAVTVLLLILVFRRS
jgi:serine/threonine-protein kinase